MVRVFSRCWRNDVVCLLLILCTPTLTYAQSPTIGSTIDFLGTIFELLVDLGMVAAVAAFLWGMVKFIWNAEDPKAQEAGKQVMIWGMIALFVMVALWGIVGFLQGSLFSSGLSSPSNIPMIPENLP